MDETQNLVNESPGFLLDAVKYTKFHITVELRFILYKL